MNPLAERHYHAAARNQTIAQKLRDEFLPGVSPPHDDWIITVSFYSALHLIDSLIVEHGRTKPRNHVQRDRMVELDPILASLVFEYFSLKDLSQTARYQPGYRFEPDAVQQAFDQLEVIRETVNRELRNT